MGVDFIIDDNDLEADFYMQMAKAYQILGNIKKATTLFEKGKEVIV